jgi:condensin complex subunit 1
MHDSIQLLIAHISQSKNTQVENIAVKNLKEILSLTSKQVSKYFYNNLSNLMQLYECENYFLRNALTEIITNVIEYLVVNQDIQHDQEAAQAARLKLVDTLLFRQHDKVAFSRQSILNALSYLLKKNYVPSESLGALFEMTTARIKDISGWVRKAAIQNLKQLVKYIHQVIPDTIGRSMW